jgi:integrase
MSERSEILTYYPAEIHKGIDYHVSYYVINPDSGILARKKIRLNRLKGATRDKYARELVRTLNEKLAGGWNPFIEKSAPKSMHRILDVVETYRKIISKDLEKDSVRSYNSFLNFFTSYISENLNNKSMYVFQFSKKDASEMMLYIAENKAKSARTYNNYLLFFRTLYNWMIQYNYCSINIFESIKKRKTKDKNRVPIPENIQEKLNRYLEENNKNFLNVMLLCYYCFIRPKEICLLKISDFDLDKGLVTIDESIAKNDHTSARTIPPILIERLRNAIKYTNKELYFIATTGRGDFSFNPGKKPTDSKHIGKYWERLRKELDIPMNISFYSLKDTGIIQMSRDGVSWKDIQDQADHSSGDITRLYAKYVEKSGSEQIREKTTKFGKRSK